MTYMHYNLKKNLRLCAWRETKQKKKNTKAEISYFAIDLAKFLNEKNIFLFLLCAYWHSVILLTLSTVEAFMCKKNGKTNTSHTMENYKLDTRVLGSHHICVHYKKYYVYI